MHMNNDNYISTIYNTDERPITSYPDKLVLYLIDRFKLGGVLIDAGCGRGDFMNAFERAGLNVIGIDGEYSNKRNVIGNVNFEMDKIPLEDCSVDVVFTKSVLEHIHKPNLMLNECYRILKPGGRIIAMVPDWHTCMYLYYDDHTHVQPYTVVGLRDCLRIFGFKNVISEQFYQLPIVWKYPAVKIICRFLQLLGPVKRTSRNKFFRFSRELILLASAIK